MAMQGTTQLLGRLLVGQRLSGVGTGVQDAITPKAQTMRNIVLFILVIVVFGLTTYVYAWYHGLWVVLACFICSSLFSPLFGLRHGSPRLVAAIAKNMQHRRQSYLDSGDTFRAQALGKLIEKLNQLSPEEIKRAARL
jgi:hypothetical protein